MFCRSQDATSKFEFTGTYFQVLINSQTGIYLDSTDKYIDNNKWMIAETDSIFNVIELKLVIFEELTYIWDPYASILYESFSECIKILNFYQLLVWL